MSILIKTSLYLIEWQITTIYDPSTVEVDRRTFFSYFQMHNYCSSCSRKIYLPVIFPKNNRSDNLPGYLSKLKFKNLEIQLFLVTAVVLIQDICI
jgi:hypothetical protein